MSWLQINNKVFAINKIVFFVDWVDFASYVQSFLLCANKRICQIKKYEF